MQWCDIEGFPLYQISDRGNVRNVKSGRHISCRPRSDGYVTVMMVDSFGNKIRSYAHRLVAQNFIDEIPEGFTVNHKNLNKSDNRVENLEIITHAKNIEHAQKAGRYEHAGEKSPKGESSPHSKLCNSEVLEIRARHSLGESYKMLSAMFGVSNVQIKNIVTRKSWRHLP